MRKSHKNQIYKTEKAGLQSSAFLHLLSKTKSKYAGLFLLWLGLLSCCIGCSSDRQITPAFYYWKTTFRWEPEVQEYAKKVKAEKLYIRAFDVEWNDLSGKIRIVAPVQLLDDIPELMTVVPVVFIENEVMRKAPQQDLTDLAMALGQKVEVRFGNQALSEFQIDCDWTPGTKEAYFSFLTTLKNDRPAWQINSTIRLHQVRDWETNGIPPLDRGMLMAYNLQSPADVEVKNSILDLALLKGYTHNLSGYPMPLDLALPIFSWGIVAKEKQFLGLLDNIREVDFDTLSDFKKIDAHTWEAQKNTYIHSRFIRAGEQIKVESIAADELEEAASWLSRHSNTDTFTVSLFHLAPEIIRNYPEHELESVYKTFY